MTMSGEGALRTSRTRVWTLIGAACVLGMSVAGSAVPARAERQFVRLSVADYRDRMKAGWIGQMVGVTWGAPTEFRYADRIVPAEAMPAWQPALVNDAFGQDDLYVEMTFLRTLEQHGLNASIRQAGIDFANSGYPLWCANNAGRTNLRRGIAPPDSSHPAFSKCPNDIDYQIEADYSGLISPGLPNSAVWLGERFGRLMNYGDGMYAGQFVGAMYSAAFLERDIVKVVESALTAIPADSQYAEMVRDMLAWYRANPDEWERTWALAQAKYRKDPEYQKASNGGIDCKINGAYVLMGLLYGKGDPDRTVSIACRCGQDSDCNPSSAAGVLFTTLGMSGVPARFTQALDGTRKFSHTAYSVPELLDVCEKLARQVVRRAGGRVVRDASGQEVFVIPVQEARPSKLELSWAPGPIAGSKFTAAEMRRISATGLAAAVQAAVTKVAPGWRVADCGPDMDPGLLAQFRGRSSVLVTHPLDATTACVLSRTVGVPRRGRTVLRLAVSHHPRGDWDLIVKADGKPLLKQGVGPGTVTDGWLAATVDLTPFAGRKVKLELLNQPSGWMCEAGYWAQIAVETK